MPQVQILNSESYETPNRAEENLKTFFSNIRKEYRDKKDTDVLKDIWSHYLENKENENSFLETSAAIDTADLSPSRRLEAQKHLKEIETLNIARAKAVKEHASEAGKEYGKLREKAVADYVNTAAAEGETAEEQKFAISQARKAVAGDIQGPGFKALFKNNPYGQLIGGLTPDEASLQAANKQLVSGTKGLFGPKPTEREIFLLLNSMLPSIGKTKEANNAGLDFIEKVNDMKLAKAEIINELTDGGTKYVPNLEQLVQAQMKPLAEALRDELKVANEKYNGSGKETKSEEKLIDVKAPNGKPGKMTQKQIDAAKEKGVIFEPV